MLVTVCFIDTRFEKSLIIDNQLLVNGILSAAIYDKWVVIKNPTWSTGRVDLKQESYV